MAEFLPKFAPNLRERIRHQHHLLRLAKRGERMYAFAGGDYGSVSSGRKGFHRGILPVDEERFKAASELERPVERLTGLEVYMQGLIDELIQLKSDNLPVILLDLGSFAGLSWHRLANHYKDDVNAGKVVFVTSSLAHKPGDEILTYKPLSEQENQFLADTQSLVQSVVGSVGSLNGKSIMSNGREIPLAGNVDVVYESKSVTAWSRIPELDIVKIPRLLSPIGLYFVHQLDTAVVEGASTVEEEYAFRLQGIGYAHEALETQYGLRKVTMVEEGRMKDEQLNYVIFKKPTAPPIKVDVVDY